MYKFGILKSEHETHHEYWVNACKKFSINFEIIELNQNNWLEKVQNNCYDAFLCSAAYDTNLFKQLYDERLYIISKVLGKIVYPKFEEIQIHENKKFFAYWLKARRISHPQTDIFYIKEEALEFIKNANFPLVAKTSIGDSGKGVTILKSISQAEDYVKKAFSSGIRREFGPNLRQGDVFNRGKKVFLNPSDMAKKIKKYIQRYSEAQKGYVIFYEYIPHDYEWRAIKIGDSYFAHKKVKFGEMASGSKGIDYVNPPLEILDFIKDICEKNKLTGMAIDIFEGKQGEYLVNEMQTSFGHVQKFVMTVDGVIGRYKNIDSKWIFEAGDFNTNMSYDLRMEHILNILNNKELLNFYYCL
ncbi:hypothetical protein IT568_00260 [bacterium]|nr:hypothetical protein [bacterium]